MSDQRGAVIGRGARSTVFEWSDGSVIKVPFAETPDSWAEFEFRYSRAVADMGVRVPAHLSIVELDGKQCTVSTRVDAVSMVDRLAIEPGRAEEFGRQLAELQMSLFSITPSLELPRQIDRLSAKIRRAARFRPEECREALDFLATTGALSLVLCHGDLHPRNVLMADDGPVLIDWFDACRGAPIAEVARSLVLFEQFEAIERSLPPRVTDAIVAVGAAYRAAVVSALDLDEDALHQWQIVQRLARAAEGFDVQPGADDTGDLGFPR